MGAIPPSWAIPALTDLNRAWFTSGTLAVQMCTACGTLQHPPEEVCNACHGTTFGLRELAPKGTVHSFTVVHHPTHPALADAVPYAVVLVSLDEEPHLRVVGNLLGSELGSIRIGLEVEARWERRTSPDGDEIALPQWVARTGGDRAAPAP